MLSIKNSVVLLSLDYDADTKAINYVFLVDNAEKKFSGRMHDDPEIRGLGYTEELDAFIMSLMPFDHKITSKLFKLSWAYVDGGAVALPVTLISI